MPKQTASTRRSTRRPPQPKRTNTTSYNSTNYPLPKTFRARLVYAQEIQLNPGAGTIASQVFSASSLYDPDNTGIGHQPYGFDQICSTSGLYDQFIVERAHIEVTTSSAQTSSAGFCALQLVDTNSVTVTEPAQIAEQPLTKFKVIPALSAVNPIVLSMSYDAAQFYGVSKSALLARTDLMGSFAGNPTENAFFQLHFTGLNSIDMNTQSFIVRIVYDAVFQEPRKLAMS